MSPKPAPQHTPGPWRVDAELRGIVRINNDPTCGIVVGQMANARLVAAAPELLEGASLVLAWIDRAIPRNQIDNEAVAALRAAIAQALP